MDSLSRARFLLSHNEGKLQGCRSALIDSIRLYSIMLSLTSQFSAWVKSIMWVT